MLVVISDETVQAEWCCSKRVTEETNDVEIKSVVNLQWPDKRAAIVTVKMNFPWF